MRKKKIATPQLDTDFFIPVKQSNLDTRGGKKSDVYRDLTMLTTGQFVEYLDDVVDFVKIKYPNKKSSF